MTSPCDTATQIASLPCASSTRASISRTASRARACISASDSAGYAAESGKRASLGRSCTTFHSSSETSSLIGRPVQAP